MMPIKVGKSSSSRSSRWEGGSSSRSSSRVGREEKGL